jgi:uncharacterized protein (DUF1330 family)
MGMFAARAGPAHDEARCPRPQQEETDMPKGYWIAHIRVTVPETYRRYDDVAPAIVAQLGGRYTVDAGRAETAEGDASLDRHVVVEFPSYEAALSAFRSEAYRAVVHLRHASAECSFTIAEGA